MNAEILLNAYTHIADASDAVDRLRQLILTLAVSGKLIEHDPQDDAASDLLTSIDAEALINSAPRLSKALSIPRDALPFVPPSHWEWAKLIAFADVSYGFAFASSRFNSEKVGMPLIRIRDISSNDTEAYFNGEYDSRYIVETGDFLVGMDGDFNLRRWRGGNALLNQRVMRIKGWRCCVKPDFVRIPLQMILDHLHGGTSQTTVKHLSAKQVNGIEIPLPPLAEQQRIVAKVEELMALCDQLEAARAEREAGRDRLTAATLARLNAPDPETFPPDGRFALDNLTPLTTRPDQIAQLRQTILNLAVRGKLMDQDARDEPASELFNWIVAEKACLAKAGVIPRPKDSTRDPDYLTKPLPASWLPIALGDVCNLVTSGSRGWGEFYAETGPGFIRAQNIRFGKLRLEGLACVNLPPKSEGARTQVAEGDLLVVITGAGVTNPALLDRDLGEAYVSQHVGLIRPTDRSLSRWLLLCLMADAGGRLELTTRAYGAGKPGLNLDNIRSLSVPLPPLAEQHRIVAKVDELMALCDRLEASLTEREHTRSRLLESVLRNALEPA